MTVATAILQQLGGNKFITMTGAKDFTARENGLSFKIGKNSSGANYVTITLNGLDLYDMKFEAVRISRKTFEVTRKLKAESNDNYCDMLQSEFTQHTGLYTSL